MKTFAELNFPGRLIAVEGLDGSGKSTQIYLLKRWLEAEGIKVYFSEWNSSELVKSATSKGKKRELLTPTTFSLIHATDFADRYERHLLPLLRAGYIVLCDRYIFTAFARDVTRGCPPEWVRGIYNFAALPDIDVFFQGGPGGVAQPDSGRPPEAEIFRGGHGFAAVDRSLRKLPHFSGPHSGAIPGHEPRNSNSWSWTPTSTWKSSRSIVRKLVSERIDLKKFKRRSPLPLPPAFPPDDKRKEAEEDMAA